MNLTFDISGSQIDGARDYQEDAFLITNLAGSGSGEQASLIICADGMGGHAAGNVASNMAIQAFNRHFSTHHGKDEVYQILTDGVGSANYSIAETVKETAALKGMGCTLVSAFFEANHLWWVSVGDSHLYLLRDGELKKKNADHSYGGFLDRMAADGKEIEPEPGFARNMLMSALTGDDIADIDCPHTPLELKPGDRIVISSDGLDTLSAGKIIHYSNESTNAKECVDNLLQAVTDAAMPRQDNTTVIVIDVHDKDAVATAVPEPEFEEIIIEDDSDSTEPHDPEPDLDKTLESISPSAEGESSGGGMGKIIGIVVLLLAIAGGAFVFLTGDKPTPRPEIEVEKEAPVTQPAPPAEVTRAPAVEPVIEKPAPVVKPVEQKAESVKPVPTTSKGVFSDRLKSGGNGPEMIWIPAGKFSMGSPTSRTDFDERPRHTVSIERMAMSKYEVSFAEYEQFANATGRKIPDNLYLEKTTHPVINVSWDDALAYTKWLSRESGHKYRLPSESEWEYAARAGTIDDYWWGRKIGKNNAHCFGCSTAYDPRVPTKRGSFKANPFGLFDTSGNVLEWVYDCYHENYEGAPTDGSVWEGGDCSVRIVRGGSYGSPPPALRNAKRDKFKSDRSYDNIGFRVVREP